MRQRVLFLCLAFLTAFSAYAQDWAVVDRTVREVLRKTGAPSASVTVLRDGLIVYGKAAGWAQLEPESAATSEMRYCIGSISKQFTAAAILLLVEEGRLSLDDKVARWLPELTRAQEVSLRQLLSMTAGYPDFWPQDYAMPRILEPVTAAQILDRWARQPLDFEPGTRWQYSNTNYTILGRIVEKVSGVPFFEFLRRRIFVPLKMESVVNVDGASLPEGEPGRYLRYALAETRQAPKEAAGWLFAIGSLAMTGGDLARWNLSMIDQTLLQPSSYALMERETLLANGCGTRYGLGIFVSTVRGHRQISHSGEISGFTAVNTIFPDDHLAISVFTNLDATEASGQIVSKIVEVVLPFRADERVRAIFEGLQQGRLDRSLLTANLNAYFSPEALSDFASSLGRLGAMKDLSQISESERGGMIFRVYRVKLAESTLRLTTYVTAEGKFEQYQICSE